MSEPRVIPLRSAARQSSDGQELAKVKAELERVKQQLAERKVLSFGDFTIFEIMHYLHEYESKL